MDHFSEDFLNELFKLVFLKQDIYQSVKQYVKYEYVPSDLKQYKKILKSIINTQTNSLPSLGVVSQQHIDDVDVQEAIKAIKDAKVVDKEEMIQALEKFIKRQKFKLLNDRLFNLYTDTKEDRKDEAIELQAKESQEILNFSLRSDSNSFLKVFGDFENQVKEKQLKHEAGEDKTEKVPFGIDVIDDKTDGGIDEGDTAMWIMRSGVGKSTTLKYTGMYACRLGYDILHIQLEGTKQEAYDKYSQMWTKAKYSDIKNGNFTSTEMDKFKKYIQRMNNSNKELHIYAFEKFGEASMVDIRELILDYFKVNGKFPDLIIIDSLDLLKTGINKKIDNDPNFKKDKMQKVAQLMKDIATEFKTRILTATQSSDFSGWNDPDQYLTRSNTEGDRTLVKPFSYVLTFNVTREENKANTGRIFIDKFRNYKLKEDLFKIKTDYDHGKFYDRSSTLEMYEKSKNL